MQIGSDAPTSFGRVLALYPPTEKLSKAYPVFYESEIFPSMYEAYLSLRKEGKMETKTEQFAVLIRLMANKLHQHEIIFETIANKGGVKFLQKCEVLEPSSPVMNGCGMDSPWIAILIGAYKLYADTVKNEPAHKFATSMGKANYKQDSNIPTKVFNKDEISQDPYLQRLVNSNPENS